jgi:hypothetical protein
MSTEGMKKKTKKKTRSFLQPWSIFPVSMPMLQYWLFSGKPIFKMLIIHMWLPVSNTHHQNPTGKHNFELSADDVIFFYAVPLSNHNDFSLKFGKIY